MSLEIEFNPQTLSIDTGTQIARGGSGGGEISDALKQALLQMAEKVAYIDADGQDYYQDLYDALYPISPTYTITNNLTDVTNSNSATSATEGSAYTATLSCAPNYEITSVTITMGGNDVTGTAYAGGTISIPNVTGNIVITAVATQRQATLSSISAVYTQSGTVYTTDSLDSLKSDLVVTAIYTDSSTSIISSDDYTLSGTLIDGSNTITVSYSGKTTTFTVVATSLLYGLYNQSVSSGDGSIDTGVTSLAQGLSTTILMDITTTANPTSSNSNASTYKLFVVYNSSSRALAIGKYGRSDSNMAAWWMASANSSYTTLTAATATGRKRIVVTHDADSNMLNIYTKINDGTVETKQLTNTFTADNERPLFVGGNPNGVNALPSGTIDKFEVYARVWSEDERNTFFT